MARPQHLRAVAIKLWLVAIVLTLGAAGTVYLVCKSNPAKANGAMASVLRIGGKVCVGLGLAALACDAALFMGKTAPAAGWRRGVTALPAMAALGIASATALWLDPRILEAWDQIKGFGEKTAGDPALLHFKCLLGANFALLALQAFFVLVAASLQRVAPAPEAAGPTAPETKAPEAGKP